MVVILVVMQTQNNRILMHALQWKYLCPYAVGWFAGQ